MSDKRIIYLLGAGRSGTTLMATVIGAHKDVLTIGEMHQFLDHIVEGRFCSCGEHIEQCVFWKDILTKVDVNSGAQSFSNNVERHRNIPRLLITGKTKKEYLRIHDTIFSIISETSKQSILLDSSKYIARYLLLRKSNKFNVKGIYVIRDVRGVIHSFKKKVQTSRSPLSTVVYYCLINLFGQLVCWTDKNVLKVRYEDFVENPSHELSRIYKHIAVEANVEDQLNRSYEIPHIMGGNRLKSQQKITIKKDEAWKVKSSKFDRYFYYILTLPLMLINKYKP